MGECVCCKYQWVRVPSVSLKSTPHDCETGHSSLYINNIATDKQLLKLCLQTQISGQPISQK